MRHILFLLFFFQTFLSGAIIGQPAALQSLEQTLQDSLDQMVGKFGWPGITCAIVMADGRTIDLAAGYADKEAKTAMQPGARMLAGSVGKIFVSALVLQVMHEKGIDPDTPISTWLKGEDWFSDLPNGVDITLRHLLGHTSGIPRYVFSEHFMAAIAEDPMKSYTVAERLGYIAGMDPLHPAGEGWGYSDTNYIILGYLAEKWTGESYYDLISDRFINKYALTNTAPAATRDVDGLTQAYIGENNFFSLPKKVITDEGLYVMNPQFEWTGGGVVSNTNDLATFLQAIHRDRVIPQKFYPDFIQARDFRTGALAERGYGFGTFVWATGRGLHYGHAGIMPGYLTQVEYSKDHGFAIAIQINTDQGPARELHNIVLSFSNMVIDQMK